MPRPDIAATTGQFVPDNGGCTISMSECKLQGRQALVLASDAVRRHELVQVLASLGLHCASPEVGAAWRAYPPAHLDLLLLGNRTEASFAEGTVKALLTARPWVPVVIARDLGRASLLGADIPFDRWYEQSHALPAEDLRRLVARALCRAVRNPVARATCPAFDPGLG